MKTCDNTMPLTGLEPVRTFGSRDFKSLVSANSTTAAYPIIIPHL